MKIQAKGRGYAIVQVAAEYNVDREKFLLQPQQEAFELEASARFSGRNSSSVNIRSCQRLTLKLITFHIKKSFFKVDLSWSKYDIGTHGSGNGSSYGVLHRPNPPGRDIFNSNDEQSSIYQI